MFKALTRSINAPDFEQENNEAGIETYNHHHGTHAASSIDKSVDVFNPDLMAAINKKHIVQRPIYKQQPANDGVPIDRTVYVFDPVSVDTRKNSKNLVKWDNPGMYNETLATFPGAEKPVIHGVHINATHYVPTLVGPDHTVITKTIGVHRYHSIPSTNLRPIFKRGTLRNNTMPIDVKPTNIKPQIDPININSTQIDTGNGKGKRHKRPGPTSSEETDAMQPSNDNVDTFDGAPPVTWKRPKKTPEDLAPRSKPHNKQKPNNVDIRYGYNFPDGSKLTLEFVKVLNKDSTDSFEDTTVDNDLAYDVASKIFKHQHSIEKDLLDRISRQTSHKRRITPDIK